MYAWIAVAVGGALGSVARHDVNRIVHQEGPLLRFPLATVIVKYRGVLRDRSVSRVCCHLPPADAHELAQVVFVGMLGGFTTFSTFGLDTITLVRSGDSSQAVLNHPATSGLRARKSPFWCRRCRAVRRCCAVTTGGIDAPLA